MFSFQFKPADKPRHSHFVVVLLTLYLSQGIPSGFLTQALPVLLRQYHVSLVYIGFLSFLLMPWTLKFLWAPWVDRYFIASMGHNRSWIIPTQLINIILMASLALFNPQQLIHIQTAWPLFLGLLVINILSATQDIATDGLAVRTLAKTDKQWGNALQVMGYRIGLIVGGGGLLIILGHYGWQTTFLSMAGLFVLLIIPILLYKEPRWTDYKTPIILSGLTQQKPHTIFKKFVAQFGYFWQHKPLRMWLMVIILFRLSDGLSATMVKPMLVDMHYRAEDIGLMIGIVGSMAAFLGAAIGAGLIRYMAKDTALLIFNLAQILATGIYAYIAWLYGQHILLHSTIVYVGNAIEHVTAAMALVAFLTLAMEHTRVQYAASDYTFQVCLLSMSEGIAHLLSGIVAKNLGYFGHFTLSIVIGLVCLIPMIYWRKRFYPSAFSSVSHNE